MQPKYSAHPYPTEWNDQQGYLTQLGRRKGDLMSLPLGPMTVALHGETNGLISIRGLGAESPGRYGVTDAMGILASHGAFDPNDEKYEGTYASGAWDLGDVAAVVAPWLDLSEYGAAEFAVDDIEMQTDGDGNANPTTPTEATAIIIAEESWDLGPGGGGSPLNDDSGEVVLLRIGPRYVAYQCSGGEVIADAISATSDADAISQFHSGSAEK